MLTFERAEHKTLVMHPHLAKPLGRMLAPYRGKKLDAAEEAVRKLVNSNLRGSHRHLLETYAAAIARATDDQAEAVLERANGW